MNRACKEAHRDEGPPKPMAPQSSSGGTPHKFDGRANLRAPKNPVNRAKSQRDT